MPNEPNWPDAGVKVSQEMLKIGANVLKQYMFYTGGNMEWIAKEVFLAMYEELS